MTQFVKKKYFGQHFLKDRNIARKTAESLQNIGSEYNFLLEIGPGEGILTKEILELYSNNIQIHLVEIDKELISHLEAHFPDLKNNIINRDFLKLNFSTITDENIAIIGNFPYNISSQIIFKILDNRAQIPEMSGMFQKELADRVASRPGNKTYGILSVLTQAYYDVKILFPVSKNVFSPPPKVESAVLHLARKPELNLKCRDKIFYTVVKQSFNQRRKTLRNTLKSLIKKQEDFDPALLSRRPETLSVDEFIDLSYQIEKQLS